MRQLSNVEITNVSGAASVDASLESGLHAASFVNFFSVISGGIAGAGIGAAMPGVGMFKGMVVGALSCLFSANVGLYVVTSKFGRSDNTATTCPIPEAAPVVPAA